MKRDMIKYSFKILQRNLSKRTRLYGLLWRIYCRLFGPGRGIFELHLYGKSAKFFVHSSSLRDKLSTYDREKEVLTKLIQKIKPGDVVWDIGAEIGLYTFFLAQAVGDTGEVIAFEPENRSYARLIENAKLNNLKSIRVYKKALGEHSGQCELIVGYAGMAPSLSTRFGNRGAFVDIQSITVIEGDRLVKEHNLRVPRVLKIDVEGYEYSVLKGLAKTLSNSLCQIVCCEIHPTMLPEGITSSDIINLLQSYGFRNTETFQRGNTFHALCTKTILHQEI